MAATLPKITEADVQRLSVGQSFERGYSYYRGGALFEPVRQGNELWAYCEGSSYEPYRVTATLGAQGIISTHCTCPYDWGGICKHRVALLLTWVHRPDSFHTLAPLDELLTGRSKEELILLIQEMLKREPDLARLLELPVQPDRQTPLDLNAFRRQIAYALSQNDYDDYYHSGAAIAVELGAVVDTADRFRDSGDWANAGAIYALILDEVVSQYMELYDENGDVGLELQRCAEGLELCFDQGSPDAETRRDWLETLLEAEIQDIAIGGIDLAAPAGDVVIEQASDEEWEWIEARIKQAITAERGSHSSWGHEALVRFLTRRLAAKGQTAQADDLIFELGSPQQRAFLLLEQERFAEAVALAKEHFTNLPGLVKQFANALVEAGAGDQAVAYVVTLLNTPNGSTYLSWLAQYAEQAGDLSAALEWWRQSMRQSASFKTYLTLRGIAQQLDLWERLRPELLAELEAQETWPILIDIALEEEAIDRALELLPKLKYWFSGNYELKVAQAAEKKRPQASLEIYDRRAKALIKARGRGNYETAARLLVRMRDIHQQQGRQPEWQRYISQLRQEHRNLPALQDELNKAGLVL